MKRIVCVGGVVLDRVYAVDALPSGGGKTFAHARRESGGGIAATAACAIAALGGQAVWIGPVGGDPEGQEVVARMRALGVDVSRAQIWSDIPTPVATALVDREGERRLVIHRDSRLGLAPIEVPECDAVMVDHRHVQAAAGALRQALARGLPSVLDADAGSPPGLQTLVSLVRHAVFSRVALATFAGIDDPAAGLAAVARTGAVFGVTLGEHGSLFLGDSGLIGIGTPQVRAIDTTGCGDVFHGAYALAVAEGRDVAGAARFAAAAAALKAEAGQGWDGLPGRQAVEALVDGNW